MFIAFMGLTISREFIASVVDEIVSHIRFRVESPLHELRKLGQLGLLVVHDGLMDIGVRMKIAGATVNALNIAFN